MNIYDDLVKTIPYRNRDAERAAKRARRNRLLAELLGPENVRSAVLAFNPFSDFGISRELITPANRTRKSNVVSYALPRSYGVTRTSTTKANQRDNSTPWNPYDMLPPTVTVSTTTAGPYAAQSQPVIRGSFVADTTRRTRGIFSERGELELYRPRIYSTSRSYNDLYATNDVSLVNAGGYSEIYYNTKARHVYFNGPSGRITQDVVDSYLNEERSNAQSKFSAYGTKLLTEARPNRRSFEGFREFLELKDLPRLLRTANRLIVDAVGRKKFTATPEDLYLNKEFGWDPLFGAIMGLVVQPEIVAKRMNYILSRVGKATTFRSSRFGVEALTGTGGFSYQPLEGEANTSVGTSGYRIYNVRMAVNYGVRFPELEVPKLKRDIYYTLIGLKARPSDFYNVVPWTWLIDWFTGIGDYVDLVSSVLEDHSLVNWGTITYASRGTVTTTYTGETIWSRSRRINSGPIELVTGANRFAHSSVLGYAYQLRKDLGQSESVKYTWLPDTWSDFQASILGALLTRGAR